MNKTWYVFLFNPCRFIYKGFYIILRPVLITQGQVLLVSHRQPTHDVVPVLIRTFSLRAPYGSYGEKDSRPRSRSPVYGREGREPRDGREAREGREPRDSRNERASSREPRPGAHSRDDYRFRSSSSRDKDLRSEPRDTAYRLADAFTIGRNVPSFALLLLTGCDMSPRSRDDYDRFYRSGSGADDFYRRKDEPYREPYRDPWNGRRELEGV